MNRRTYHYYIEFLFLPDVYAANNPSFQAELGFISNSSWFHRFDKIVGAPSA